MTDIDRLQRFVDAHTDQGTYQLAVAELRAGHKRNHWMWFVFPQLAGLGQSMTSRIFAIGDLAEARAYLDHPVLGPRLRECAKLAADTPTADAERAFGEVDALKLRSSMTLFARAAPSEPVFQEVLAHFYGGEADPRTLRLLGVD